MIISIRDFSVVMLSILAFLSSWGKTGKGKVFAGLQNGCTKALSQLSYHRVRKC